ncbi:hypothetical protein KP79_PYT23981 [Mizuhopecten yessoensis]|uniref:Uncharacterized protein n=1 Tax=Mizuhopecten yessoensis TaxID=6573 RepID=A0A210QCD9_MIZYE|nr:hypothetical protein KP79_PYT23981 [Mizuhopecten yessoensis]
MAVHFLELSAAQAKCLLSISLFGAYGSCENSLDAMLFMIRVWVKTISCKMGNMQMHYDKEL